MSISTIFSVLREWRRKRYIRQLKKIGLKLGDDVFLNDGFFLDPSHCYLISIEDGVTFGPGVKVFAHDASAFRLTGKTKIGLVKLKKNCFIGADSVILPGAIVGENSIIAANTTLCVVIPDNEVWGGSPARKLMSVQEYLNKLKEKDAPIFLESDYSAENITDEKRREMIESLGRFGFGFMRF